VTSIGVVLWSETARRELPARANGRTLVLDYFAARCCGSPVSIGDLSLRWLRPADMPDPEFVRIATPDGLDAWVQRDLVTVLREARATVDMHGFGRFRRPTVTLQDGAAWLDFIGACRSRSPLRH